MPFIKVIGMFDERDSLERAKRELIQSGLANEGTIRVEPEELVEDLHPPKPRTIWERLKDLIGHGPSEDEVNASAEGVRRGSMLLVVTVPEEKADEVRQIMRRNGAVELRRRVRRWAASNWTNFDPAGLAFTEEELVEERRACIDERAVSDAVRQLQEGGEDSDPDRNVLLFDEETGRFVGRISEDELRVLRDALEEEDPDDNDYWINDDEIDELACRPGATAHLIALLRSAVRGRPDGIDLAFERAGEPRQGLRKTVAAERHR